MTKTSSFPSLRQIVHFLTNDFIGDNVFITLPFAFAAGACWIATLYFMAVVVANRFFPAFLLNDKDSKNHFLLGIPIAIVAVIAAGIAVCALASHDHPYGYVLNHLGDQDSGSGEEPRPKMWFLAMLAATPFGCLTWWIFLKIPILRISLRVLVASCNLPRYDHGQRCWIREDS